MPPPGQDPEQPLASKGCLAPLPPGFHVDKQDTNIPIWSLAEYGFLTQDPPPLSVNPSLWRNANLNMYTGLFQVVENAVYQVRGMDLSNISFLEDPHRVSDEIVVLDPLVSAETAAAALKMYRSHRPQAGRIAAVIFSHSHVDHYGGVLGLFEGGVVPDDVDVFAPDGFLDHAVSENVYAGNAMERRALYMYGTELLKGADRQVDAGLGKGTSTGTVGLVQPNRPVQADTPDGETEQVGPLNVIFQLTPNTEAPAEMNFFLPDINTMCMAENATPTLHNIYSLRGAQVRDAKAWSQYLNDTVAKFGQRTDVMFASHFWPRWRTLPYGTEIVDFWSNQADLYRYLHDQTLRLANEGYTLTEIAERLDEDIPSNLKDKWYNHGYYGTTNHNIKAVYQRYLGWYDGNATRLHGLPPEEVGARYVKAMGDAGTIIAAAQDIWKNAKSARDYRWAVEMLNHVVFSDPGNTTARQLEADFLEQLGYQAESAPWRNFYLSAAQELRERPVDMKRIEGTVNPRVLAAMPIDMVFDYLAIRLDPARVKQRPMNLGFTFRDPLPNDPRQVTVQLRNNVLVYLPHESKYHEAAYDLTREAFDDIVVDPANIKTEYDSGNLTPTIGTLDTLYTFFAYLVRFDEAFAITTP